MTFAGGTGTYEDPYLVSTAMHLNDIRNHLSKHFKQVNDIDLSEYSNWIPIGYQEDWVRPFTGAYDGCNFKITGLKMYQPPFNYDFNNVKLGLFSEVSTNHELKNIYLESVQITGASGVGSLTSYLYKGDIINCSSSGEIIVEPGSNVGGLIGTVYKSGSLINIKDCSSSVNIRIKIREFISTACFGGLIGVVISEPDLPNEIINIFRCFATGDVILEDTYDFFHDYTSNSIRNMGGLIGEAISYTDYGSSDMMMINIRQCYSTGAVKGVEKVGGLIGSCFGTTLTDCYSTSNLYESLGWSNGLYGRLYMFRYFGGLLGTSGINVITNCYSCGKVANAPYGAYTQEEYHGFAGPSMYSGVTINDVSSSYFDVEKAGRSDNFSVPKTTIEIKSQNTYVNWDFDKTWGISTTVNNGYPFLLFSYELPDFFSVYVITDEGLKKARKSCLITNESVKDIIKVIVKTEVD